MLNHSKSLLLSLSIHALILLSLFGLYKYTFSSVKPAQQEKKICIHLACVKEQTSVKKKINRPIKEVSQPKRKVVKKTPKKPKVIHKKVPLKKKIKKEEPKVVQKPVTIPEPAKIVETSEVTEPIEQTQKVQKVMEPAHNRVVQKKRSDKEQYLKENLTKISALIKENLYYPRTARKRGIEGSVTVRFILHEDATVTQITTISSSSGILTRAAIKTIAELSGKFPKPSKELMLSVPITYSLH